MIILPAFTFPSDSLELRGNSDRRKSNPKQADKLQRVFFIFRSCNPESSLESLLVSASDKAEQRLNDKIHMIQLVSFQSHQAGMHRLILSRAANALHVRDYGGELIGSCTGQLPGDVIELTH